MQNTDKITAQDMVRGLGGKSIVLVGMMGSGKTTIGRIAAGYLGLPFLDSDEEIEKAENMSISDIFTVHGEAVFRTGECRIVSRLLDEKQSVLALGGGAFLSGEIRSRVVRNAISIWLRASPEVLYSRVARCPEKRPLLQTSNPEAMLEALLRDRESCYARADIAFSARNGCKNSICSQMMDVLARYLKDKNSENE